MFTSVASENPHLDVPRRADRPALAQSRFWLWLAIAAGLLLFANGANTVSLAAWLGPVVMLRFMRGLRLRVGLPVVYLLLTAEFAFQFRGMVPIPGIGYYIFLAVWGLTLVLPYVIDRCLAHRLSGLAGSLVFPAAWAATEYLVSHAPYGTWGSAAYSQYGNLALLQVVSVTGLWGVTFLIGWFATTCNWLWAKGFDSEQARRAGWLCAGTIAAVMLLGGARMALAPAASPTVRMASLSRRNIDGFPTGDVVERLLEGVATPADRNAFRAWSAVNNADLLARGEREMQAGARIVFWAEGNAWMLQEEKDAFVARGADLAAKYHVYLGMALDVVDTAAKPCCRNMVTMIQPDGKIAWDYDKARPVPGPDARHQVPGDGKLRIVDTPYGRLSSIICFDGDFPQLLAQAGALQTDVMLDPSSDWRAIDPWHTQMASFRPIEQGFNLVRQTSGGLSAAFDYQGRRLAAMDHYQTVDFAMVSQVPTKGVRTIYSRFGDWFAWTCLAGLALLLVKGMRYSADASLQ
jgi:apolipoprotein N-acyltransferase